MDKKTLLTTLEAVMLVIWVITLIIFLWAVYSDNAKCSVNPLIYGVAKMEKMNNNTFSCSCSFNNQPEQTYFVDSKHWELKKGNNFIPLNLTG